MKYEQGPLSSNNSGKLGGIIFSKNNPNGNVRTFRYPINSPVQSQMIQRATFQFLSRMWRALSDYQRNGWNLYSENFVYTNRLGQQYKISGFNQFMKVNQNITFCGHAPIEDPPSFPSIAPASVGLTSVDIVTSPGSEAILINFSNVTGANDLLFIYATGVLSRGISKPFRFKFIAHAGSTFVSGDDIFNLYTARFGYMPRSGEAVFFRCYRINFTNGLTCNIEQVKSIGTT